MKKKMSMEVVCSDCGALIHSDCDLKEVGLLDGDGKEYYQCRHCECANFRLR